MEISGVGKGIAEHIEKLLKTGYFLDYDKLKKEIPDYQKTDTPLIEACEVFST